MAEKNMLYVASVDGQIVDMIENYQSLIWNVSYSGIGEFELVVPFSMKNYVLLNPSANYVLLRSVDRVGDVFRYPMILRSVHIGYEREKGYTITARGYEAKDILRQRVIWNRYNEVETLVELMVYQVILDSVNETGERAITSFVPELTGELPATSDFQLLGENVGDWVTAVASENGYGTKVLYHVNDGQDMRFSMYAGKDRTRNQSEVQPVIFSPSLDNLISASYDFSQDNYFTTARIGGEGEGANKKLTSYGDEVEGASRFETYVDGSSVSSNGIIITEDQYINMLKQYGRTELEGHTVSHSMEAQIDTDAPYKLGEDYDLGDIVELDFGVGGIRSTMRLVEITFSEDSNGIKTLATFEEKEVY